MIKALDNNIIVEKMKTAEARKKDEDEIIKDLVGNESFYDNCGDTVSMKEDTQRKGVVVSVGDKVSKVKAGDTIIYKNWSSDGFTEGGKDYESVEEYGVIAAVTEDKKDG